MTANTHRTGTADGVFWWENADLCGGSRSDVGITDGAGRWLSLNGRTPYFPRGGRRAAAAVLDSLDLGTVRWVQQAPPCQACTGPDRACASCQGTGRARPAA